MFTQPPHPVRLDLPADAKVPWNLLYLTRDPAFLFEGILLVELPGNRRIDVSWYPQHCSIGSYTATLFRDSIEDVIETFESKYLDEIVDEVRRWAAECCF